MAENKKSVLLYCDIIHTIKSLTDEEAGALFKHYLEYINDLNPKSDRLTELLFEPIKQNLKRDLKKWEGKSERNSLISKEGWRKRKDANAYEGIKEDAKHADKVTVTVTDTVKVKDININKKVIKISFDKSIFFDKVYFSDYFSEWNKDKKLYYYNSAMAYSTENNKYVDWGKAINNWAKRDELQGKLKFSNNNPNPQVSYS